MGANVGDLSLADYFREANRDLAEVYGKHGSWTSLRREAGLPTPPAGPDEDTLLRRLSALSHVDDEERTELYARVADPRGPAYEELTVREQTLARMLFFTIWPNAGGFSSYESGLAHLRSHPAVCSELRQVAALGLDRTRHLPRCARRATPARPAPDARALPARGDPRRSGMGIDDSVGTGKHHRRRVGRGDTNGRTHDQPA